MRGTLITSRPRPPIGNLEEAVREALRNPVQSPPLRAIAKPGQKVCVVFTDATRICPDHVLVPALLSELEAAGVAPDDVTLLCAVGMHRPSTPQEKSWKLGEKIVSRYRVVDHDARDPSRLKDLGHTRGGIPIQVNRMAWESDLLIATGVVEPHQYAGYSGGSKTLSIGAGGEALIRVTHGPQMVDHPGTRLGKIEGNPFQEAVQEAARRAGLRFVINVVQDDEARPLAVAAGDPHLAYMRLVKTAREIYEVPVPQQFAMAVAGVGFPKDVNLYQASRAVSYLFFAPTPLVREGGLFILPAEAPEGVGEGVGERRFHETMREAGGVASLLTELRRTGYPPGAQRAFILAKVLEKNQVIVVSSAAPELVRDLKMIPAADMDEALQEAGRILGRRELHVAIVPHALLTLPIVVK
jgi:nickel-dependent lactate racemase